MKRRTFLLGSAGGLSLACVNGLFDASAQDGRGSELTPPKFPFEISIASGPTALSDWERLRRRSDASYVIVGGVDDLSQSAEFMSIDFDGQAKSAASILATAEQLSVPESLYKLRLDEARDMLQFLEREISSPIKPEPEQSAEVRAIIEHLGGMTLSPEQIRQSNIKARDDYKAAVESGEPLFPPTGSWPDDPVNPGALAEFIDWKTSEPLERVYIARIPTHDWTEIPAYLRFGGWNACPAPEYHVAAMRSWHDRYGAELVVASSDVIELRVARRPGTRREAMALAKEFYLYCPDTVEQGTQDLSTLAALLLNSDNWYFWWD